MTKHQPMALVSQLRRLGFAQGNHMKLYGQKFEMVSDPIFLEDDKVLVDAVGEIRQDEARANPVANIKNLAA